MNMVMNFRVNSNLYGGGGGEFLSQRLRQFQDGL